jgi:hypothetical protein
MGVRRDVLRDVLRIPAGAEDQHRAERVLEREPSEVESWSRLDDAALLLPAILVNHRQVDPAEVLGEAGSPDHVRDVEDGAVV